MRHAFYIWLIKIKIVSQTWIFFLECKNVVSKCVRLHRQAPRGMHQNVQDNTNVILVEL